MCTLSALRNNLTMVSTASQHCGIISWLEGIAKLQDLKQNQIAIARPGLALKFALQATNPWPRLPGRF